MSSSLAETLNSITIAKLQVLSKQHSDFHSHSAKVLSSLSTASSSRKRVKILVDGITSWRSTDKTSTASSSSNTYLHNIEQCLLQAQHDPSIGEEMLREWETNLTKSLDTEKVKFEYAELFGRLLTEWITSSASFPEKTKKTSKDRLNGTGNVEELVFSQDVEMTSSMDLDPFERVGRKEMHEQRATFNSHVFTAKETDAAAITAYLEDLFSSKAAHKSLARIRERIGSFGSQVVLENMRTMQFNARNLKFAIQSLLVADLLSNEKRDTLNEFTLNKTVLTEIADVLNMHLSALPSWSWIPDGAATDAIPVQMRRQLNGKYRIYMDEEILQAIFLHWIGLKWAVEFKRSFLEFFNSEAWKLPTKPLSKNENERREYFLQESPLEWNSQNLQSPRTINETRRSKQRDLFFMNQLPDCLERGAAGYGNFDVIDTEADPKHMTTVDVKQSLLHILATECLFNTTMHNKFTVVCSDFSWFGPSLSHTSTLAILKFFGVPEVWLTFFQKYLSAPIKFVADGPSAPTQIRKCGVPICHSLSDLFGEVVLFCMDYAVNQRVDGLFVYRIFDDFWWWNSDPSPCVKAWQEMNTFARLVGLKINDKKTGSVSVGQPLHPDLPKGPIKWGLLKFEETGQFVIDQFQVDVHIDELKLQLKACHHSVFAWVQAYNKYMGSLVHNFGSPPAQCLGKAHVDMVLTTLQRIQLALFPDHGGSITEYLADVVLERFGVRDIPVGWFLWPVSMGGLEVKSPFISQYAIREIVYHDPLQKLKEELEAEKERYHHLQDEWENGITSKPYTSNVTLQKEPFLSYEEYALHREQRFTEWRLRYDDLQSLARYFHAGKNTSAPYSVFVTDEIRVELGKLSPKLAGLTGEGGISRDSWSMDAYWVWVVACFGEGMIKKWGGLEIVKPGSLPVGMVEIWKSRKVRWEQ